jgi:hypothetical protein
MDAVKIYEKELQLIGDLAYSYLPPKVAGNYVRTIRHWLKEKGPSFVVDYFKTARALYLSTQFEAKRWEKGILRNLKHYLVTENGQNGKYRLSRFLKLLKIYTYFKAVKITKSDYIALREDAAATSDQNIDLLEGLFWDLRPKLIKRLPYQNPPLPISLNKVYLGRLMKAKPAYEMTLEDASNSFLDCPRLALEFYEFLSSFLDLPSKQMLSIYMAVQSPDKEAFGRCTLLNKDGALKLRDVYNPLAPIQLAMEPLFQALTYLARRLPTLFVYDQEAGAQWAQEALKEGPVWTVDLTSASMTLPFDVQYALLSCLLPAYKEDIRFFARVSRGNWITPYEDVTITFNQGQPMGLLPSFLSFSLMLYYVCWASVNYRYPPPFAQVGDDLIVKDEAIVNTLYDLNFSINKSKTFRSTQYAEFVGRVLTENEDHHNIRMKSDTKDPLSMVRAMGWEASRRYFRRNGMSRIARAMSIIRHLPPPFGLAGIEGTEISLSSEVIMSLYESPSFHVEIGSQNRSYEQFATVLQHAEAFKSLPYVQQEMLTTPFLEISLPGGHKIGDFLNSISPSVKRWGWSLMPPCRILTETLSTLTKSDDWKTHLVVVGNLMRISSPTLYATKIPDHLPRTSKTPRVSWRRTWDILRKAHLTPQSKDPVMKTKVSKVTLMKLKPQIEPSLEIISDNTARVDWYLNNQGDPTPFIIHSPTYYYNWSYGEFRVKRTLDVKEVLASVFELLGKQTKPLAIEWDGSPLVFTAQYPPEKLMKTSTALKLIWKLEN